MTRKPPSLLNALVALAAYLGAGFGDASGVDPCPHHDFVGLAAHAVSQGHAHGHDHASHSSEKDEGDQHHGPCTCVGCSQGGTVALPTVRARLSAHLVPPAFQYLRASPDTEVAHDSADLWALPLPNAPPLSV